MWADTLASRMEPCGAADHLSTYPRKYPANHAQERKASDRRDEEGSSQIPAFQTAFAQPYIFGPRGAVVL
jgi:hypothetical protein